MERPRPRGHKPRKIRLTQVPWSPCFHHEGHEEHEGWQKVKLLMARLLGGLFAVRILKKLMGRSQVFPFVLLVVKHGLVILCERRSRGSPQTADLNSGAEK
jgi:hypothetical protein